MDDSTCVTGQATQRTARPQHLDPATVLGRAYPQRAKSPPHGHTNSPADTRRSTSAGSVLPMITGASISTKERPSLPAKEGGGPLRFHQRDRIVVAHQAAARWRPTFDQIAWRTPASPPTAPDWSHG